MIDVDSFVGEVRGRLKQGTGYGHTKLFGYHPLLATRPDTREALHKGSAMEAGQPDVIAFNGYANQYKDDPILVDRGHRVRLWVRNAGPSEWSAFQVIGSVFDRTVVEGVVGHDSQTIDLAPSQGGYVELTLDREGTYPFVTQALGDMVKGAAGALQTENAPAAKLGMSH